MSAKSSNSKSSAIPASSPPYDRAKLEETAAALAALSKDFGFVQVVTPHGTVEFHTRRPFPWKPSLRLTEPR